MTRKAAALTVITDLNEHNRYTQACAKCERHLNTTCLTSNENCILAEICDSQ